MPVTVTSGPVTTAFGAGLVMRMRGAVASTMNDDGRQVLLPARSATVTDRRCCPSASASESGIVAVAAVGVFAKSQVRSDPSIAILNVETSTPDAAVSCDPRSSR